MILLFKENRGEIGMGVLLLGVVALAVLILVGYGIYSFATDKAIPFAKYLPNFMTKDRKVEGIEKLRYKIIEDKVQYYDGTDWLDFKDEKVELGGKTLIENNVKNDFRKYYFGIPIRTGSDNLFIFLINKNSEIKGQLIKNGYVTVVIKETKEQVVLNNENEIYIVDSSKDKTKIEHIVLDNGDEIDVMRSTGDGIALKYVDSSAGLYKTIKDRAIAWRDSILKKPVEINYLSGDSKESVKTCIDKEYYNKAKDLVVDLTEEREGCG